MYYDPTRSLSFSTVLTDHPECAEAGDDCIEVWNRVLISASIFMDDQIRVKTQSELAPCRPLQFLVAYMERHEEVHYAPFEWGPYREHQSYCSP